MPDQEYLTFRATQALAHRLRLHTSTIIVLLAAGWVYSEEIDGVPKFESPLSALEIDVAKRANEYAAKIQAASHAGNDNGSGRTDRDILSELRADTHGSSGDTSVPTDMAEGS